MSENDQGEIETLYKAMKIAEKHEKAHSLDIIVDFWFSVRSTIFDAIKYLENTKRPERK